MKNLYTIAFLSLMGLMGSNCHAEWSLTKAFKAKVKDITGDESPREDWLNKNKDEDWHNNPENKNKKKDSLEVVDGQAFHFENRTPSTIMIIGFFKENQEFEHSKNKKAWQEYFSKKSFVQSREIEPGTKNDPAFGSFTAPADIKFDFFQVIPTSVLTDPKTGKPRETMLMPLVISDLENEKEAIGPDGDNRWFIIDEDDDNRITIVPDNNHGDRKIITRKGKLSGLINTSERQRR